MIRTALLVLLYMRMYVPPSADDKGEGRGTFHLSPCPRVLATCETNMIYPCLDARRSHCPTGTPSIIAGGSLGIPIVAAYSRRPMSDEATIAKFKEVMRNMYYAVRYASYVPLSI